MKLYLINLILSFFRAKQQTSITFEIVAIDGDTVTVRHRTPTSNFKLANMKVNDQLEVLVKANVKMVC